MGECSDCSGKYSLDCVASRFCIRTVSKRHRNDTPVRRHKTDTRAIARRDYAASSPDTRSIFGLHFSINLSRIRMLCSVILSLPQGPLQWRAKFGPHNGIRRHD